MSVLVSMEIAQEQQAINNSKTMNSWGRGTYQLKEILIKLAGVVIFLSQRDLANAWRYFYRKATLEFKEFSSEKV